MSMEVGSSNSYLTVPRHSWWSTQTTKEKKLILISGVLSVLLIVFFVCTIALGSKARYEPNCVDGKNNKSTIGQSTTSTSTASTTTTGQVTTSPVTTSPVTTSPVTTSPVTTTTISTDKPKLCRTKECKKAAFYMKIYMNEDVDPCHDFHGFACGGYQQIHKPNQSVFGDAQQELNRQLQDLLQTADPETQKNPAIKSTLKLYKKCIDQASEDPDGFEVIKKLIKEILGTDWPMAVGSAWNESTFDWGLSLAKLNRLNSQYLLQFEIIPDPENPTRFVPALGATLTKFRVPDYLPEIVCKIYPDCSTDILVDDTKKLKGQAKSFVYSVGSVSDTNEYNIKSHAMKTAADVYNSYLKRNLTELAKDIPQTNWTAYFTVLFENTGYTASKDFHVYIRLDVLKAIATFAETNKRNVANMFAVHLLNLWGQRYSPVIRKQWHAQQDDICLKLVNQVSKFAVARLYTDKYLNEGKLNELLQITYELRKQFRNLVLNASWLDELTMQAALKKVDNITSIVALPGWALEDTKLQEHYKDIHSANTESFPEISQLAAKNEFKQFVQQIGKQINRSNTWPLNQDIAETNAVYHFYLNSMYYPLGILVNPFYATGRPRAIKYGPVGYIAGHEITHGFDSNGKDFDETGRVNNWWHPKTLEKFKEKAKCIVDQYSAIKDKDTSLMLNGSRTLAENIADAVGLRAAYQAYKSAPTDEFSALTGFEDYTEDQLFFISAAQVWCSRLSKEVIKAYIEKNVHSPPMYRIFVPFQNFLEHSKAFGCEAGKPMNPSKKCQIW